MTQHQGGPKVTASSHDESIVRAFVEAGIFDASSHDNSKLELSVKTPGAAGVSADGSNWQKWGVVIAVLGIVVTIILAVVF